MSKKILILETSVTLQKLFTTSLDSDAYSISFVNNGKNAIYALFDFQPDLFLVNCDLEQPRSFEVVRLVRSMTAFKELAIGMYANFPTPLDECFAKAAGATAFVRIDPKTLVLNVDELAELSEGKISKLDLLQLKKGLDDSLLFMNASNLLMDESYKNIVYEKILDLTDHLEDVEYMLKSFLSLIAEICEVPVAGLYMTENDGPHGYYVCSENFGEKEINDFLSVCASDFEKVQSDYNASKVVAKKLDSRTELNGFYNDNVHLSSYESENLKSKDGKTVYGTVHIVSEGNIGNEKQSLFSFCVNKAGVVFEKALIVKKKIFFEKRIRKAFGRFVPEQIIDSLVLQADTSNEEVAVGETRAVAILFSDIRSFTNISEKNKPDVLVAFLNRYLSKMVDIIKKHGGTIDKFIGDAIMAEFGTPVSYEDNCHRAVAAAMEMREAIPTVELEDLILPEGMEFNIGIGIHYGDVIVGSIGSKDKTDYSVIGDNVNLASRLEGLTKTYGTQILVSGNVREDAGKDSFLFRHIDDVRVKGKHNAVPIYAIDRSEDEFPSEYKDSYSKGMDLYKQGIWNLARDYFKKALDALPEEKAASVMLKRCDDFIANPPESWDGATVFTTK